MRIAFVGKGGSGKSTLAAFFIRHLLAKNYPLLAVDADMNIHLASHLGIPVREDFALSKDETVADIRRYLRGTNASIPELHAFIKSTPPGRGSQFFSVNSENYIIKKYALKFAPSAFYAFVGTYQKEAAGSQCYHANLAIFENILSHSRLNADEWLVGDMVAGIDAFANTLHIQFDRIVLVVEPTPEGISVFRQYFELASAAGITNHLSVIGNKVVDKSDREYLKKEIGPLFIGFIEMNNSLKKARRNGQAISLELLTDDERMLLSTLQRKTEEGAMDPNERLARLKAVHNKIGSENWVKATYGDITKQIDHDFRFI